MSWPNESKELPAKAKNSATAKQRILPSQSASTAKRTRARRAAETEHQGTAVGVRSVREHMTCRGLAKSDDTLICDLRRAIGTPDSWSAGPRGRDLCRFDQEVRLW